MENGGPRHKEGGGMGPRRPPVIELHPAVQFSHRDRKSVAPYSAVSFRSPYQGFMGPEGSNSPIIVKEAL